jgi:hypothetical protein
MISYHIFLKASVARTSCQSFKETKEVYHRLSLAHSSVFLGAPPINIKEVVVTSRLMWRVSCRCCNNDSLLSTNNFSRVVASTTAILSWHHYVNYKTRGRKALLCVSSTIKSCNPLVLKRRQLQPQPVTLHLCRLLRLSRQALGTTSTGLLPLILR